jgi:hypothetical protein
MKNKDQKAIFESYREEILKKFKQSLESEKENKEEIKPKKEKIKSEISDDETIDNVKKKVVLKSEEISTNIGPQTRAILRHLPAMVEEKDILFELKKAIERANAELDSDNQINKSPLKVYDRLIEIKALYEDEMDQDDFEEKEAEVLQNFDDNDYREDDDQYDAEVRRDIEKGKAEELIKGMGTDWRKHDEDFYSSNY